MAEFLVGLEVIAFGPLVPGLDEDEIFFGGSMGDGMESFLEVGGEEFGGGAMEDRTGSASAGGVIPTWDDGGVATEGEAFFGDMKEAFVEEFEFIGDDGGVKAEGFPREIEFVVEEMSDEVDPWEAILGG